MDKKQTSPELLQAELPPAREEQVPANPPSRKRQLDSDDDAEPRAKRARATRPTSEPARLTRQNLARFNKMGKKKTSDPSDDSGSTKTTSTTSSGFAIKARNNGILEPAYSKPPANLEDIRRRQAKSRATASPPESVYNDYVDRVEGAGNEATVVVHTSELLKKYPKGYRQAYNRAFTNLPGDVGFNNGLSAPQPDLIEGLEAEEYRPFPADDYLPGAALYKDDPRSITLPQIAGEWKGPAGDMREAGMQSAYDGAAMVHARTQALGHMGKSDPPGHASITTFTTDGKNINFFAHYAAESEDGTLEYHQFPIKSTSLVNSHGEHKEGRRGLRNAQDHAREQSYALKDQLKEHYKQQRSSGLHPIAEGVPTLPVPGTEPLHAYEDEDDYEVVEHQPVHQPVHQPTQPTSSKHKSSKTHSHHSHSTPHSSKAPSSTHGSTASSGQKRKVSSSQTSSQTSSHASSRHRHKSYWKKDPESGRYYHKHSDGTVSWLSDDDEE
ncbi:hypothetical protein H9Q72_013817 [Fusarium xylarioides]|uniref:DUF7924 domain-containing protein n=1 Tax=Fusarium xylarioides TaxID=221167 RepID=A0A9P7HET7_9HYPO|nr:hypothetical protein H9Q72_013817 [Fusarium xylarioides]